jgi:tRNA(His) 5'-end guanylyltransferase
MDEYESAFNIKLIKKLPIIIVINGRSFKKFTSLLDKPFSQEFKEIICGIMIRLISEIDGCVLLYSFNDEIIAICRNDQSNQTEQWYDGRIQQIVSVVSCIASLEFNKLVEVGGVKIIGDPIFKSNVFILPNISETINYLVSKQQEAFQISVSMACFHELLKKYNSSFKVKEMLYNKTTSEKIDILKKECDISMDLYPSSFTKGVACYRIPKIINDEIKNKITIDTELPIFTQDHSYLKNILNINTN